MGRENRETIRSLFEGLSRSREERERAGAAWHPWFDAWLREFFHPEVEWRSLADEPDTEVHRGYDGIRRMFDEWTGSFEGLRAEAEEFIEAGEYVIVPARLRGLGVAPNHVVSSGPPWRLRVSRHSVPRRTPDEAPP